MSDMIEPKCGDGCDLLTELQKKNEELQRKNERLRKALEDSGTSMKMCNKKP